jgi:hypothetical protein
MTIFLIVNIILTLKAGKQESGYKMDAIKYFNDSGIRSLAIKKRFSRSRLLLGLVNVDFGRFGSLLAIPRKKRMKAANIIVAFGVRPRIIERKLSFLGELRCKESELFFDNIH